MRAHLRLRKEASQRRQALDEPTRAPSEIFSAPVEERRRKPDFPQADGRNALIKCTKPEI